ncbi:MAG: hypothetical protein WBB31_07040 [Saprospiraceae bacterium]
MKKLTLSLMTALLLVSILPMQASAAVNPENTALAVPATTESAQATVLINRLSEIKAMDISSMKGAEKKQLRKEVKSIKSQLKTLNGGVYLSVGAIIIILLIIILLL